MTGPEEEQLITRTLENDSDGFASLVGMHYATVYRCAYRFCGHKEDAEDIAQEVFIKAAAHLHQFNRRSSFSTWLYRITVNAAHDLARKNARHEAVPYENGFHHPTGHNNPSRGSDIINAMKTLPDKIRTAMTLVYGEGLSHKEAADVLKCAETTISWRIYQGKRRLQKILS